MKKLFVLSIAVCLFSIANAQPPAGKAKAGDFYGKNIETANAKPASKLPAMLEGEESINVKLSGKVTSVCPKKGCWATLQLDDNTTATIRMKGYSFFVPTALIGKTIVVDGKAEFVVTSVKDLKHQAEDAKKSQAEIDAITEAKQEYKITANGIKVVK